MLNFNNAEKTVSFDIGVVTIENTSNKDKTLEVYVPNRYNALTTIPAGGKVIINSQSSGESFMYLTQDDGELKVSIVPAVAKVVENQDNA